MTTRLPEFLDYHNTYGENDETDVYIDSYGDVFRTYHVNTIKGIFSVFEDGTQVLVNKMNEAERSRFCQ